MLVLDDRTEPYWISLPREVRVQIKPCTTAIMAAAQASSARRLGLARAADASIDGDLARGLAFAFLVKALAVYAITAWDGIGDAEGNLLDPTPDAIELLMDMDEMAAAFWERATAPVAAVVAEGNA